MLEVPSIVRFADPFTRAKAILVTGLAFGIVGYMAAFVVPLAIFLIVYQGSGDAGLAFFVATFGVLIYGWVVSYLFGSLYDKFWAAMVILSQKTLWVLVGLFLINFVSLYSGSIEEFLKRGHLP